ncbi:TetR family transcriptional regulator [Pseudonocardia eucalypti]|uniref:TetR family transcriptional regulator n=1 Tax=Pseudonocardia eucalypti TaxID=648755 RepID=A0ABP9QG55_9PSEU|nr:AcrR family transcriptional regulator [Pseudonocardia eucalypti]
MELRERKKALLRDAIVRNAVDLFERRGFDAVSVEEICQASTCSRSTFHRYFGSKEDLLFPTAAEKLETLAATLDAADAGWDPWEVARDAVSVGLRGFLDDLEPDLQARCIRLWFSEAQPRRRYLEIVLEWETVLSRFFGPRLGVDPATSLECQLLASSISSALRAALGTAMATGDPVEALIRRAFEIVETGLSANLFALRQTAV